MGFGGVAPTGQTVAVTAGSDTSDRWFRGASALLDSVCAVRVAVADAKLPLELAGVAAARSARTRLLDQLSDYVIPRLEALDAPLLAVVGGSTGSGKSTLVNSLVGARGVVARGAATDHPLAGAGAPPRLTNRGSRGSACFPGLSRITGGPTDSEGSGSLRLVSTDAVWPGLALVDAPDIDSVVAANRELRRPAARRPPTSGCSSPRPPATPMPFPWDLLREAAERGHPRWPSCSTGFRRRPSARFAPHLASMLREQGLAQAPLFTVTETGLHEGLLPRGEVGAPC